MKIFVSYARVDKPYCIRIIETLHAHDVWYDQRLYAGQDWWKEILRRLDWCDVFVYLLSPDSVASLYCRRELDIAQRLKRDVIPVMISGETVLPDKMREWQYVDLSDSLTVENVSQLLNAILLVERQRGDRRSRAAASDLPGDDPASSVNSVELVSNAVKALENGEYDQAILLLKQAKASGYQSRFVSLDKLLRIAESAVAEHTQSREVQREYQHIVALFSFASTRQLACEALEDFKREFGDYDPQGLRKLCDSSSSAGTPGGNNSRPRRNIRSTAGQASSPRVNAAAQSANHGIIETPAIQAQSQTAPAPQRSSTPLNSTAKQIAETDFASPGRASKRADSPLMVEGILPMLQWCDIPHGTVHISSIVGADEDFGEMAVDLDNYVMSKYPVTNAQYAIFTAAQDGYKNPRWWHFSEHAARWFKQGKGVAESRFNGGENPRENVNWYEAMAFANWLSNMLQMKVTLPTIAQWQRAAKGDDDRYYPWGDDYHEERCNTSETGLKATTPVNRYDKGVSPYGVYDMAGNIWEWTVNTAAATDEGRDQRRAVAGGSFVSPCDRAQTSSRYYLDPRVRYSSIGIRLVGLT